MAVHEPLVRVGMSVDKFIEQYDEAPFELINGEKRMLMPVLPRHNIVVALLYEIFAALRATAFIEVYFDTPFVLSPITDWVEGSRVPDILVYAKARMDIYKQQNPDWQDKPFALIPDLCIEVVSKNDKMPEVLSKVETYLDDGVKLVWVFEPKTRTVTVRTLGSQQATILRADDTLEGGSVVAGFRVRVGDILT